MCGGSPSAPAPPPELPEAARTPEPSGRSGAEADARRRRAAAGGTGRSTILTSSRGTEGAAATQSKTLLGE